VLGYNYNPEPDDPADRGAASKARDHRHRQPRPASKMDEDFMADGAAPFGWKSEKGLGPTARLTILACHPVVAALGCCSAAVGRVVCQQSKPYATRTLVKRRPGVV